MNNTPSHGFRISFLDKISSVKGGSISALDLIVMHLSKSNADVFNVLEELGPVRMRVSTVASFDSDVKEMIKMQGMVDLEMELCGGDCDEYVTRLNAFHAEMSVKMRTVVEEQKKLVGIVNEVMVYFGENDSKVTPEDILTTMDRFLCAFEVQIINFRKRNGHEKRKQRIERLELAGRLLVMG